MEDPEPVEILVEWPEQEGLVETSLRGGFEAVKDEAEKALNLAMGSIRMMAYRVSKTIQDIEQDARPDEVEVEFSIKLDCESGAVIPMIAKTSAGGQFTVKFKWALENPEQAKLYVSGQP
jgi:nitrate/nitrite-specific signal transduction histidine kinase